MKQKDIILLYEKVKEAIYAKNNFYFLVNTTRLQNISTTLDKKIPILTPTDIYGKLDYQAVSKNSATGYLRFISDIETDTVNEDDIIVIDEVPLYLPKVAGVILTKFQTPLSHMAVLGLNRRIPIIAYKSAFKDENLLSYNGKKVRFRVYADSFKIHVVPKANRYKPRYKIVDLKYNLSVDSLVEIKDFSNDAQYFAGNKAANFYMLLKLSDKESFRCPESSFVIPFSYYLKHAKSSKAQELIEELLFDQAIRKDRDSLTLYLKRIRTAIRSQPMSESLQKEIDSMVLRIGDFKRMRFRSSTNAEDAFGFSGAGIYASSTGILNNPSKSYEKAVKKVWASLWSYEAFVEREIFHINHTQVFMGVLVHRSFQNEKANGVAITKNLYRRDSYGYVVNVQIGEHSVVNPEEGVVCDQFVCYPNISNIIYKDKNAIDIITKSNINNGVLVMSENEIRLLAEQLSEIKNWFYYENNHNLDFLNFGMGVEFKLVGEKRELYIKQARFYND
jgi:phosphoenolpyruvate synthase/pyruvate phosphate dikinase